ncbi:hypothetical protein Pfo_016013 [Paulownia fortunei]|nr:hypothetical protein Pfo_016013 [Paulownia fortunei]
MLPCYSKQGEHPIGNISDNKLRKRSQRNQNINGGLTILLNNPKYPICVLKLIRNEATRGKQINEGIIILMRCILAYFDERNTNLIYIRMLKETPQTSPMSRITQENEVINYCSSTPTPPHPCQLFLCTKKQIEQ